MFELKENQKWNDEEIARYAEFFNKLCVKNNITAFWWDTSFLVNKNKKECFNKVVDAIMGCYPADVIAGTGKINDFIEESASVAVKNMKTGWNLGNTFDAKKGSSVFDEAAGVWKESYTVTGLDTETCWFQPKTTREMIEYVKSLGFCAVRMPVTWAGHLDENNNVDKLWLARIKEVADWILQEGLYCIINVHHDGGGNGWARACESSYNQYSGRLESIYRQICKTFDGYSEKLLFGSVNEMLDAAASWADPTDDASYWINKWNQLFVDTVRSCGESHLYRNLVVMAGAGKSSIMALQKFKMPQDKTAGHLIFEFHDYTPQRFCWHQNKEGTNKGETPYWNEAEHGAEIKKVFDDLMTMIPALNVPVICGEYAAWPKIIEK